MKPTIAFSLIDIFNVEEEKKVKTGSEPFWAVPTDVLSVYLEGGPRYTLDGRLFNVKPPFSILIPAGVVDQDMQDGKVDGIWMVFNSKGLVRKDPRFPLLTTVSFAESEPFPVPMLKQLSYPHAQTLDGLIRRIKEIEPGDKARELRRTGLLYEAIAHYCQAPERAAETPVHPEILRMRELIVRRAFEPISLSDIYAELDLSLSRSEALFVKTFGMTPVAFRTELRLTRACELLTGSDLSVGDVARSVGFTDQLYFWRIFKKRYGFAPSRLIPPFRRRRRKAAVTGDSPDQ